MDRVNSFVNKLQFEIPTTTPAPYFPPRHSDPFSSNLNIEKTLGGLTNIWSLSQNLTGPRSFALQTQEHSGLAMYFTLALTLIAMVVAIGLFCVSKSDIVFTKTNFGITKRHQL